MTGYVTKAEYIAVLHQRDEWRALTDALATQFAQAKAMLSREFDLYDIDTSSLARWHEAKQR